MSDPNFHHWLTKAKNAEREAHEILARFESSTSKVVILKSLLRKLAPLPIDIRDYFGEAVSCLERQYVRAATVLVWAGFFQVFAEGLFAKHEAEIRMVRPKWSFRDLTEMKENYPESQILDVARDVKFISRGLLRVLQGHLATRNQCAHPTLYKPSMNSSIGYVDEMIDHTTRYI